MKYIDANVFIWPVLYNDSKAEYYKKIAKKIAKKEIIAYTSYLTWDEVVHIIKKHLGREIAVKKGKKLLRFPNLIFIETNDEIINKAQDLITNYNLGPRDAIHIASALTNKINEIISDDSDFDKIKEIKRIKPV